MIRDYFSIAYEGLKHRKLRSWLTMLGIFIGIASIVSLFSLGQGLQVAIDQEFEDIGLNKIIITPGSSLFSTSFVGQVLNEDDMKVVRDVRGVSETAALAYSNVPAKFNDKTIFVIASGLPIDNTYDLAKTASNLKIMDGRDLKSTDKHKVMIGYDLATSDAAFGKKVSLNDKIVIGGIDFEVVAILESIGNKIDDRSLLIPIDEARKIIGYDSNQVDGIIAEVSGGYEPSVVAEAIKKDLRRHRHLKEGEEDFQVQTYEKVVETFKNIFLIVQLVVLGITSISLIIGGIGIMNTMYTAVVERTADVGIMKSVGATNSTILLFFLIESGLLGVTGGAIGVLLGVSFSKSVEFIGKYYIGTNLLQSFFPWYLIVGTIALSFILGALAGVFPAYQASKLQPMEALRK